MNRNHCGIESLRVAPTWLLEDGEHLPSGFFLTVAGNGGKTPEN